MVVSVLVLSAHLCSRDGDSPAGRTLGLRLAPLAVPMGIISWFDRLLGLVFILLSWCDPISLTGQTGLCLVPAKHTVGAPRRIVT